MDPLLLLKFVGLMFKNIRRGMLRSILTAIGTMALVVVVTLVWTVLHALSKATQEKEADLKVIVTERWQIPSQIPFSYGDALTRGAAQKEGDLQPIDAMTWQFYGGTLDLKNRTRENTLFAFAMQPSKLDTMMDDLDDLPEPQKSQFRETVKKLDANRQGLLLGRGRLLALDKKIGERIKLFGLNYRGIDLEFEIVGTFPEGRYDDSAAFNRDYLNDAMDAYPKTHQGKKHPLAEKSLNLVWLRVPDREAFTKIAQQIETAPSFSTPAVKCETSSSGIASFLEAYRDLFWGLRYLFSPAAFFSLTLVISNAISISVRERRLELAVMKVLGFRPVQILFLVLGESLLLGAGAGFLSALGTYCIGNWYFEGLPFRVAFFPKFLIPDEALWWGPALGGGAALLGTIVPAWNACRVKVTDVFARVA